MEIIKYLEKRKITIPEAAKQLKKSRQHVWEVATGRANPSFSFMMQVHEWSNHLITFDDFKKIKSRISQNQ